MVELDRAEWAEKTDLFLLFMTATVGLGNVYAFPYAIYTNGYGAYLILYVLFMVVVGQPLYLLEAIMGQFSSCGPLHVFSCFPLAKGLGLSMCLLAAMRTMDAGLVLTQGMLYWVGSFTPRMPWMTCDAAWGADLASCYVRSSGIHLCEPALEGLVIKKEALNLTDQNRLHAVPMLYHERVVLIIYEYYVSALHGCVHANQSSAEQYYTNHILNKGPKAISRDLLYCSAAVWLLIFLAALNIRTFMWVAGVWTLVTCVTDEFPSLRPLTGSLIAAVCMVGCVASLPYTTPYGYLIALLVNRFAVQIPVLLVACLETLSFVWGYGVDRLLFDVNFMEQGMLGRYWIRCWSVWTPCALLGVLVATFVTLQDFVRDLESHYDVQAKLACQFLLVGSLAGIPFLLVTWLMENNLDVNLSLLPCAHWGPREALYFRAYHEAIKHSDLPAQKKVHKTDRKETVAERFTLYLVRHSPKYMGRFIKGATTAPARILFTRRVRDPFPCE
ncbi:sodium-dependent nutrient amino acid transporter 1-like [Dermacentor silvarum]|uniref:sodium-dependent nutrient amino acid transporter 1-like n=1 Tax=Dermacentor silvarum TaxID=543639 RepID=UPI002100C821|nr:sodium-dependent nutrient amino acid transporter 1-like [Dermacentor silvarum]